MVLWYRVLVRSNDLIDNSSWYDGSDMAFLVKKNEKPVLNKFRIYFSFINYVGTQWAYYVIILRK